MPNTLGEFIKDKRGKTSLRDFAKRCGISHTHLDSIEKGYDPRTGKTISPTLEVLKKISKGIGLPFGDFLIRSGCLDNDYISHGGNLNYLSEDDAFLIIKDEMKEALDNNDLESLRRFSKLWYQQQKEHETPIVKEPAFQYRTNNFAPILGSISAGITLEEQQDIRGYMPLPPDISPNNHFYLEVNGDSMEPQIPDRSLVLVRAECDTTNCNHGKVCCVQVNNEYTIKRLYRYDDRIELVPDNPKHQRQIYTNGTIKIVGIVEKVTSTVK